MTIKLRKLEAGVYATEDDRWLIMSGESEGEVWSQRHGQYIETSSPFWVGNDCGDRGALKTYELGLDGREVYEGRTRKEVVAKIEGDPKWAGTP